MENVQPGRGNVSVANGVREAIAEIGDLGPLKGAQKVNSFGRTLVSVFALAKQFGGVFFDEKHVFVTSATTAEPRVRDKDRRRDRAEAVLVRPGGT